MSANPHGVLAEPFELAKSKVSVQCGEIRVRLEAAGTPRDREKLAAAIAHMPKLIAAAEKAWAVIFALENPDPPTQRVALELGQVLREHYR